MTLNLHFEAYWRRASEPGRYATSITELPEHP
jgi:hypothetical protein